MAAPPPEPSPCPAALPAPGSGEPPFRHLDCIHYDSCLDVAILKRWESWGCTGCRAFQVSPRVYDQEDR
ncbi:MAG TPA: hypothetical protein VKN99_12495 [Polyangia bacterium]|nr:hypothetical protein [Polyangia bacterium]